MFPIGVRGKRDVGSETTKGGKDRARMAEGLRQKMEEQNMTPQVGVSWSQLADKLISDRVEPQLQQPTFLIDYLEQLMT